jgi:predicted ribosomally synthesized peptide with SipW-like signal peptide
MKKILLSLSMVAVVAVLGIGATGAFFSDSETSTGNTFTAGAIDLTVDSEQHYNGHECIVNTDTGTSQSMPYVWGPGVSSYPVTGTACDGTWLATNLGAQKFFNFLDVKPGDEGENTISLHVDSNDAYACVDVNLTKNDDVSTVDPETDAGDLPEAVSMFDGELAQNVTFFAWSDWGATPGFGDDESTEGDNIWQANEPKLFSNTSGPASDVLGGKSYTLADSTTGPLVGNSTSYIGLAWCAGTINASVPGVITCDGSTMGNMTQTDSMEASVAFRVEQARNNSNFKCVLPVTNG